MDSMRTGSCTPAQREGGGSGMRSNQGANLYADKKVLLLDAIMLKKGSEDRRLCSLSEPTLS